MTQEERYRQQAVFFIKELNKARMLFANHKPSIGYVGEELLRLALRDLLPKEYDVCQGFVLNNEINKRIIYQDDAILLFFVKERNLLHIPSENSRL